MPKTPRALSGPFISYAQNFEDVILNRALKDVNKGCYIDVGAHDPIVGSVSLAFYNRGWRGVHVEASPTKAEHLRAARPDEVVIEGAVSCQPGAITFYEEATSNGLSTGDADVAAQHRQDGASFRAIKVPTLTLDDVFAQARGPAIHWLKIDVEGMEKSVLHSWQSATRPWILVIEATKPGDPTPAHQAWEPLVLALGYDCVYFDGLNRFYLHEDQRQRAKAFGPGPNVFDDFFLGETEGTHAGAMLAAKLKKAEQRIGQLEAELKELRFHLNNSVRAKPGLRALMPAVVQAASGRFVPLVRASSHAAASSLARALLQLVRSNKALHRSVTETIYRVPILHALAHRYLHQTTIDLQRITPNSNKGLAALRLAAAIKQIAGLSSQSQKLKMAFLSPLPPDKSGVASYSATLLPHLAAYYDIDGVVQSDPATIQTIEGVTNVISIADFRERAYGYDRIIYNFGNAEFHIAALELSEDIPGIILMHETHLGEIMLSREALPGQAGKANHALWEEGGYRALALRHAPDGFQQACSVYPLQFSFAKYAQGVLTTSSTATQGLLDVWHNTPEIPIAEVRLARPLEHPGDKRIARQALGIAEEVFLICSFGHVVPTKGCNDIWQAFRYAKFATPERVQLVFVGGLADPADDPTGETADDRVRVTGYVDQDTYNTYLQAADMAIQLRQSSRGESSGAVLDALAQGLPTIVNARGAMAELPDEVVLKLPATFDIADLSRAFERLQADTALRCALAKAGRSYVQTDHDPASVAALYHQQIEQLVSRSRPENNPEILRATAAKIRTKSGAEASIEAVAERLIEGRSFPVCARRLLFDVSGLAQRDFKTGIQRVLRAQFLALNTAPPAGFRVEPVRWVDVGGKVELQFARRFAASILSLPELNLPDISVDLSEGDVYFGADYCSNLTIGAHRCGCFSAMKAKQIPIYFTIYDQLPIDHPDYFPESISFWHTIWMETVAQVADGLICISDTVNRRTRDWLAERPNIIAPPRVATAKLGAEIDQSNPSKGIPKTAAHVLKALKGRQTFLMVGSVCPRRGHQQVLAAFNALWADGADINLVIVGTALWPELDDEKRRTIPQTVAALDANPERDKRLFWLAGISDEYLERLYEAADVFIAASRAEGFGLPLIEAAKFKLPIIARDIPVFREIAGDDSVFYFSSETGTDLAEAIKQWQRLYVQGAHPRPEGIQGFTWENNRKALLAAMQLPDAAPALLS